VNILRESLFIVDIALYTLEYSIRCIVNDVVENDNLIYIRFIIIHPEASTLLQFIITRASCVVHACIVYNIIILLKGQIIL